MKTPQEIRAIVDGHRQLYLKSCSPSLVEMILKIEGAVPADYYALQNKYKDENVGISKFSGVTIEGITFHVHDESKEGSFADRIAKEWAGGRLFAAYTANDATNTDYHGWIISDLKEGSISLLSKFSEDGRNTGLITAESSLALSDAIPPKITDLLFYTKEEKKEEPNQTPEPTAAAGRGSS